MGAAFLMLCVNLVGQSLGPLLVGVMSDHFSAAYGNLGLRYALLISTTSFVAGGVAFLMAARTARADMAAASLSRRSASGRLGLAGLRRRGARRGQGFPAAETDEVELRLLAAFRAALYHAHRVTLPP